MPTIQQIGTAVGMRSRVSIHYQLDEPRRPQSCTSRGDGEGSVAHEQPRPLPPAAGHRRPAGAARLVGARGGSARQVSAVGWVQVPPPWRRALARRWEKAMRWEKARIDRLTLTPVTVRGRLPPLRTRRNSMLTGVDIGRWCGYGFPRSQGRQQGLAEMNCRQQYP
ncbi:hypothetical protein [Streptomyces sp. NPDC059861]|uniref:hypothetical protein n=1 Tax=Streptomyces sp. NPDC059861 TaxID=3346974 RepID=UPI00364FC79F